MIKMLLGAIAAAFLMPIGAQAAVMYQFTLLDGGARYGENRGNFTLTLSDFVKPIQQYSAGAGNVGGFEMGQTVPLGLLSNCSITDAQGVMPCGDQIFLQGVTSFAAGGTAYDVLQFGMEMYPGWGFSYNNYYFNAGTFQNTGVFNTVLLPNQTGILTITSDQTDVPEPASLGIMFLGFVSISFARLHRRKSDNLA